jgi:carbonic anhydrase
VSPTDLSRRSLLLTSGAAVLGAGLLGSATPALAAPTSAGPATAAGERVETPAEALACLLAGNRRFVAGRARHPHQSLADRARHPHQSLADLHRLASGQQPFAVTVGCADSRVPPELIFDQGLGDLFDNRVAGNIVDDLLLGSIEFAVEEFGSPLIVILGHERCGAINATINAIRTGAEAAGHIGDIVTALRPIVEPVLTQPGDPVDNAVRANIHAQAARLIGRSEIIAEKTAAGELRIVGARYDLDTGKVTVVP